MSLLHSQIFGTGKPLLVLHGFLGMSDNWRTMGKQWVAHFEVHLIDLRNHGHSFHSDAFSYADMAADLKEYSDHHQLEQVIVLGHSMGGKLAMHFATTNPEQVEKLVVADIAPKAYPPHHDHILEGLMDLHPSSRISWRCRSASQPICDRPRDTLIFAKKPIPHPQRFFTAYKRSCVTMPGWTSDYGFRCEISWTNVIFGRRKIRLYFTTRPRTNRFTIPPSHH